MATTLPVDSNRTQTILKKVEEVCHVPKGNVQNSTFEQEMWLLTRPPEQSESHHSFNPRIESDYLPNDVIGHRIHAFRSKVREAAQIDVQAMLIKPADTAAKVVFIVA